MSVCRVCMRVSGDEEEAYLDIFKTVIELENDQEALVAEVIQDLCNEVVIKADDKITTKVCSDCGKRLRDAYELKHLIEESAKQLKLKLLTEEEHIGDTVMITTRDENISMGDEAEDDSEEDAVAFLAKNVRQTMFNEDSEEDIGNKRRKSVIVPYEKRKYKCDACDKRFIRKSNLVDHLRFHANQREFKCEFCSKTFIQAGNYRAHLRIHTGVRPYVCSFCDKSYNQPSALTIHVRSHTNERNYPCEICGKRFTNSSDKRKHEKVHDSSQKIKCPYCDKLYAQKVNLKNHIQSCHNKSITADELRNLLPVKKIGRKEANKITIVDFTEDAETMSQEGLKGKIEDYEECFD